MCGIAGFVCSHPPPDACAILKRMTAAIRHRGPDEEGFHTSARAFLGHRRLSIIDLASGHQPMTNETGSLWITYNGEIFNHAVLRPVLENAGHRYATRCDTETVLHAFEEHGPACLSLFRGMFSFALWDNESRTLFCARDRLGIKPFYYFWDGALFAFASEIKALLEHPAVPRAPETDLLPEYLAFGYVSEERTLFRGIRKLLPGHHLTIDFAGNEPRLSITRYWDSPPPTPHAGRGEREWVDETRRRLEESVELRLMSDVPLGMFLSGGVDSSAIAAIMKRKTSSPVKTFSVGYRESPYSELTYAAQVAQAIGTEHHETVVGMSDFFNALPRLVWHEDEPVAWPSSVSLYFVSLLASQQVKVVLTGEGADELFAGYERYRWNLINRRAARFYSILPSGVRASIRDTLTGSPLLRAKLRRRLGHTVLGRDSSVESLFLDNFYAAFSSKEQSRILGSRSGPVYGNYLRYWNARPGGGTLARMLYADAKTYLVELLMKQDQMSMAASIESRVPFLDHEFFEFAAAIPDHLKIRGANQKYVLKRAVEDLLPREIIYRKKMGFPTPLRQWLLAPESGPLYTMLSAPDGFAASFLDLGEIGSILDRHRSGAEDATDRIWRLLNLQIWFDVFFSGKRERLLAGLLPGAPASTFPSL
ncbi:MAG TPA: asparagine synthase (glutamine-hydrolyzing) [Bryobacteraceae bacterium]|nr:asparagine synthase (glutamine-hydrolyzing) [Bryobacteraceae bacterium]